MHVGHLDENFEMSKKMMHAGDLDGLFETLRKMIHVEDFDGLFETSKKMMHIGHFETSKKMYVCVLGKRGVDLEDAKTAMAVYGREWELDAKKFDAKFRYVENESNESNEQFRHVERT